MRDIETIKCDDILYTYARVTQGIRKYRSQHLIIVHLYSIEQYVYESLLSSVLPHTEISELLYVKLFCSHFWLLDIIAKDYWEIKINNLYDKKYL